jgi:hypothetical protein
MEESSTVKMVGPGMLAYTCNPSYSGNRDWESGSVKSAHQTGHGGL